MQKFMKDQQGMLILDYTYIQICICIIYVGTYNCRVHSTKRVQLIEISPFLSFMLTKAIEQ